ncbi:hypothetical protein J7L05_04965 [bacterium]|nr:hypothetical protein [bacterium]
MRNGLILIFLLFGLAFLSSGASAEKKEFVDPGELLPSSNVIGSFEMNPSDWHRFGDTGLYAYMDGAADIFLEYGFDRGCSADYETDGKNLVVELFKMKDGDAAYGIYTISNYLSKIEDQDEMKYKINDPENKKRSNLKGDNYNLIQDVAIEFFKGNIFGRIAINTEDRFTLMSFANRIMAKIPKHASRPKALSNLPVMDRIHGSERYAVGIIGMDQILDLGRGDIWGIKSGVEIVAGEYRISSGSYYSMLVIVYRNENIAESRYQSIKQMFNNWEGYKPTMISAIEGQPNVFLVRTPDNDYMGFRWLGERMEVFYNIKSPNNFKMILEKNNSISVRNPSE